MDWNLKSYFVMLILFFIEFVIIVYIIRNIYINRWKLMLRKISKNEEELQKKVAPVLISYAQYLKVPHGPLPGLSYTKEKMIFNLDKLYISEYLLVLARDITKRIDSQEMALSETIEVSKEDLKKESDLR